MPSHPVIETTIAAAAMHTSTIELSRDGALTNGDSAGKIRCVCGGRSEAGVDLGVTSNDHRDGVRSDMRRLGSYVRNGSRHADLHLVKVCDLSLTNTRGNFVDQNLLVLRVRSRSEPSSLKSEA